MNSRDLTEWEKDKEKDEFSRRYDEQIKRMDNAVLKSNRFVSTALLTEQNQEVQKTIDVNQEPVTQKLEIPEIKTTEAPKMVRTEYVWRPHPVLCKRFNVPNPHPE